MIALPNPRASYHMYQITYQVPYNNCEWRYQSFSTKEEAQRMIDFYISCGSPAKFA